MYSLHFQYVGKAVAFVNEHEQMYNSLDTIQQYKDECFQFIQLVTSDKFGEGCSLIYRANKEIK